MLCVHVQMKNYKHFLLYSFVFMSVPEYAAQRSWAQCQETDILINVYLECINVNIL